MVQQVELTSKRWKALQVAAFLTGAAGLSWFFYVGFGRDVAPESLMAPAFWGPWATIAAGVALSIAAQLGAWWHHG